jgi:hypothetical protein
VSLYVAKRLNFFKKHLKSSLVFIFIVLVTLFLMNTFEPRHRWDIEPKRSSVTDTGFEYARDGPAVAEVLGKGFDQVEDWGVWSNSNTVEIILPFDVDVPLVVSICGGVLISEQLSGAVITVGEITDIFKFNADTSCYRASYKRLVSSIKISGVGLRSPQELGIGGDTRKLGFSMKRIHLKAN